MGCCYGYNPDSGRHQLACDSCGNIGGVRKRTCPRRVLGDSLRNAHSDGSRHTLPWCSAPALCDACWQAKGRTNGVHANCTEGAAASQAEADKIEADLDNGHRLVVSATGSHDPDVPTGFTKVTFRGRDDETTALVTGYDPTNRPRLADYPNAKIIATDATGGCGKARRTPNETTALVKSLTPGTRIVFDTPYNFTDGITEDTFRFDGTRLRRDTDGTAVNVGWKNSHRWVIADSQQVAA